MYSSHKCLVLVEMSTWLKTCLIRDYKFNNLRPLEPDLEPAAHPDNVTFPSLFLGLAKKCPAIEYPINGDIHFEDNVYLSTINFTCKNG